VIGWSRSLFSHCNKKKRHLVGYDVKDFLHNTVLKAAQMQAKYDLFFRNGYHLASASTRCTQPFIDQIQV
jgi:hypothetical protein